MKIIRRRATSAQVDPSREVEYIGHRGAPLERMENTVAAFDRAIEIGADAVELDVHVTVDGVPVVHHNPTLGRSVRPLTLRRRKIRAFTAERLAEVDLGGGNPLPTLSQVLERIGGSARVYVEVKQGAEDAVVATIRRANGDFAIHSFDHAAIGRIAELAPEIPRGILFDRYPKDVKAAMRRVGARDVWPRWRVIDRALVEAVHGEGGRVIAWTVNTRRAAARLIALGVDGLCTNDLPKLLVGRPKP